MERAFRETLVFLLIGVGIHTPQFCRAGDFTYFSGDPSSPEEGDIPMTTDGGIFRTAKKTVDNLRSWCACYAADVEDNRYPIGSLDYNQLVEVISSVYRNARSTLQTTLNESGIKTLAYQSKTGTHFTISAVVDNELADTIIGTPQGIRPSRYPR